MAFLILPIIIVVGSDLWSTSLKASRVNAQLKVISPALYRGIAKQLAMMVLVISIINRITLQCIFERYLNLIFTEAPIAHPNQKLHSGTKYLEAIDIFPSTRLIDINIMLPVCKLANTFPQFM